MFNLSELMFVFMRFALICLNKLVIIIGKTLNYTDKQWLGTYLRIPSVVHIVLLLYHVFISTYLLLLYVLSHCLQCTKDLASIIKT